MANAIKFIAGLLLLLAPLAARANPPQPAYVSAPVTGATVVVGTGPQSVGPVGSQSDNVFLAGPCSGASASPTWRGICSSDLPWVLNWSSGNLAIGSATSKFIFGVISNLGSSSTVDQYTGDAVGPNSYIRKSRGTYASPTIVNSGDDLGALSWEGYNGNTTPNSGGFSPIATCHAVVTEPTPSSTALGGKLECGTTPNGASSPLLAFTIDQDQTIYLSSLAGGGVRCLQANNLGQIELFSGGCASGAGTVTSVTSANGDLTVANPTTTPVLTVVSAPKLDTSRTISITGDLSYTSPAFDGSGNVTAAGTLAASGVTAGTYGDSTHVPQCTYDAKGRATLCTSVAISTVSAANPTALVGLSAVNGSASTYMRSDGAPALSQSITPTWTGTHTFSNGLQVTPETTPVTNEGGYAGSPLCNSGSQITTNYTLALADMGRTCIVNSSSAVTLTIDKNANKAYALGYLFDVLNINTGTVRVTATTPATITQEGSGVVGNVTAAQYARLKFQNVGTDLWDVVTAPGCTTISTQTPTGTGVVTFNNIPQGYRDLKIVGYNRGTGSVVSAVLTTTFNNDTGGNYDVQQIYGNNNTAAANANINQAGFNNVSVIAASSGVTNGADVLDMYIPSYSGTTLQKAIMGNYTAKQGAATSNLFAIHYSGWWHNTSAITRIDMTLSTGNYAAGSQDTLQGCN